MRNGGVYIVPLDLAGLVGGSGIGMKDVLYVSEVIYPGFF